MGVPGTVGYAVLRNGGLPAIQAEVGLHFGHDSC
jgi:hypothetical protein